MSEITYKIYIHTIRNTGKSYIGFTSKSIEERLEQHWKNMTLGIDTHFYRGLRKYGLKSLITRELASVQSRDEALMMEQKYISEFNTYKAGYNMTKGGEGGDIINQMSSDRLAIWKKEQSIRSSGMNNGNCSGATDDVIIEHAIIAAKKHGRLTRGVWKNYVRECSINLPQNISKSVFRFNGGGFDKLREIVEHNLSMIPGSLKYTNKSENHINKIRKTLQNKMWITDGADNKYIDKHNAESFLKAGYRKGRTLN